MLLRENLVRAYTTTASIESLRFRQYPRAKPTPCAVQEREPADPLRIDLQLVAGLPVEDRDRRRGLAKLQFEDGEPVQRGIRDQYTLPREQFANLRQTQAIAQPALDRRPLLTTSGPPVATRPPARPDAGRARPLAPPRR